MRDHKLSTELLFNELKNAINKNSEILEIDSDLELENNKPKILSVEEDKNWGIFRLFFKVKDQELFYIVNLENSEKNEVINGHYYNKYSLNLALTSTMNIDNLLSLLKIKPSFKEDYNYPDNRFIKDAPKSTVSFTFKLKPNFLQNQILEFLDIMDSDKINFQKLLKQNQGILSIGIPENDLVENSIPLPIISNELIKRLSQYNLYIQFGKIIKN
ncbi:hypothetical protein [Chryseobacterium hispalense]|jgi:hypothetical protein|uniref:hypothetical protein n=1 Tax=Chryseobacterium hispalense TaxID=1453492 RepID=UPI00049392B4|nr:hypothetical protein [Chryseobacterium hispalense]